VAIGGRAERDLTLRPAGGGRDVPERDIVVIGGSAGSIEALRGLVSLLPARLPAALFLVVHVLPTAQSRLPHILGIRGPLPVQHAVSGDRIRRGRILVAPPDHHLLLHHGYVELNRGPRVNSARPAIDPLFHSAAETFGPRVCGIVLSGNLDDGSNGLRLVAERGGAAIVQDPEQALYPEMPKSALRRVPGARVMAVEEMAMALARAGVP
jgi:two-component system chemotaxis response regulator CheB